VYEVRGKNHAKGDAKSKIITDYTVTDASVHDSNETDKLLNENDKGEPFYADSAYSGAPQAAIIKEKEMVNQVCEKGAKNRPLTEEQIANNREKSRVRCRIEHIFGFMEMSTAYFVHSTSMNGMYIYNIGIKRAAAVIGLMNLTYNMFRKIQLVAS